MIIKYINFIMIALIIFFYKVHTILYRRRIVITCKSKTNNLLYSFPSIPSFFTQTNK